MNSALYPARKLTRNSAALKMAEPIKILVAGDVEGRFKELFDRVGIVHKKNGPFHLLLCVGNFFPPEYDENLVVPPSPIPALILGPTRSSQGNYYSVTTGSDISENVTYLGKSGTYTAASGLRIAYLSGLEVELAKAEFEFDQKDVKNLQIRLQNETQFLGIDILLTTQWPAEITNHTTAVPETIKSMKPSNLISQLALICKPRYHFCGLEGIHFERSPYRNHKVLAEASQHSTRFISLAEIGNKAKKKWLYAFSIKPMKYMDHSELVASPPDITECPYTKKILDTKKVNASYESPMEQASSQFFYDMSGGETEGRNRRDDYGKRGKQDEDDQRKRPKKPFQPGACWFCLASPEVEKHLVVSIGDSAYLTLAKGGLVDDHVLILPIGHYQSTMQCPKDVLDEINQFKVSLRKLFESQGQAVIFFERNYRSPHVQIQVIPVPKEIVPSLKMICVEFAESKEIKLQEMPSNSQLFQMTKMGFPYFYLELPNGIKFFASIRKGFDLQFGRELMASSEILNLPDKVDWRVCKGTTEEETAITQTFRKKFEPYDFTIA